MFTVLLYKVEKCCERRLCCVAYICFILLFDLFLCADGNLYSKMRELSEPEALNKAAAYCTTCERCISEVTAKLVSWGVDTVVQRRIVDRLLHENFVCEERYSHAFVNDKLRFNRWGRIKIAAALREKRLPGNLIKDALEQIDGDEYMNTLRDVIDAKRRELRGKDDYTSKQKILRFAASRGFEPNLIMQAIKFNPDEMDF